MLPYRGYKSRTDRSVQQCAALASNAPRAALGTGEAKATLLMDPTYFERLIAGTRVDMDELLTTIESQRKTLATA